MNESLKRVIQKEPLVHVMHATTSMGVADRGLLLANVSQLEWGYLHISYLKAQLQNRLIL